MRPQIVLFGDSITQQSFSLGGWGASLADNFARKADVLNRGYGGYNTRWALFLLHHIFPLGGKDLGVYCIRDSSENPWHQFKASEKPPVAVTIFFGANDAALLGKTNSKQHVPIKEYTENLRKIIHHLKECSPKLIVVLITPPPIDEDGRMNYARSIYGDKAMKESERTNEVTRIYAKCCIDLANELNLPSVDLWSKMQETIDWQKKFLSDGLHLTPEGNTVVYEEVVRVFRQAGLSSEEMAYDFPHHSVIDDKNPEKAFQIQCSESVPMNYSV